MSERVDWIREDVHIHATYADLAGRLADLATHPDWLSERFRDFACEDGEACSFTLALPFRDEDARLRREAEADGVLSYVRAGEGAVDAMTYAIHQEAPRELHLTVEARYRPAGGVLGALLEVLVHRPQRTQALRDSLWNLKQLVERGP